jgi:mitosis inhibitor protein kinase SWE1
MTRLGETTTPGATTASPLKRSDATMNLDQASFGSPKAKRRSYGPSSFGADFNVFDQGPPSPNFDIHDDSNRDYDWTGSGNKSSDLHSTPTPMAVPRRAGSLRQSTLQQRHAKERTSWGRQRGAQQLLQLSNEVSTPVKSRPRLSLDHYMPPPQRDGSFGTLGALSNPSGHATSQVYQPQQPHPLSRTMTTSSSNSSIPDESPTHFPTISERPRAPMNWSKSLPLGALRPTAEDDTPGFGGSISTPDYKAAKPFFGAFASTGLVSKMNRNPELEPTGPRGAPVPDTPCKRQVNAFATYPPMPGSNVKPRGKGLRHTFGAPSTPFSSMGDRPDAPNTFGNPGGRPGLFAFGKHARKGSLLSLYSDEGRSPIDINGDSQMTTDDDIPPTPTKQQLLSQTPNNLDFLANDSPTANRHMAAPISAFGKGSWRQESTSSCKSNSNDEPRDDGNSTDAVPTERSSYATTPIVQGSAPPITISVSSFCRTRAKRGPFLTPAPLEMKKSSIKTSKNIFAKNKPLTTASPLERLDFAEKASPRTPNDVDAAPDASRLSISNPNEGFLFPTSSGKNSSFPPATPTARHDGLSLFQDRRAITPTNGLTSVQVDTCLLGRFGKVEFVGQGEFSQVYRVVQVTKPAAIQQPSFFSTPTHRTPPSPSADKVFAVKKLKLPLKGSADRALRLREVTALDAMKGCDHVLQLIDSWEEKNNLYIQTEYCEEGSLDVFLADVGLNGRLDDFRIWKIMLELTQVWRITRTPYPRNSISNMFVGLEAHPRCRICPP